MERTSVGVGSVGVVLCLLFGGCSWDEFKERSRMAVVGASDAVVHAPRKQESPQYRVYRSGRQVCVSDGMNTSCTVD